MVYLDEDVSPIVARLLRDKGVDAVSVHEVGRVQLDDRGQLAEATGAGRAIVTANVVDFLALAHDSQSRARRYRLGPVQRIGQPLPRNSTASGVSPASRY
jgi:predicted nuclease of predicted toxin-antitoxin system